MSSCKLCGYKTPEFLCEDKRRPFYLCGSCGLISVPREYWLSGDDEWARYELHDNGMSNEGYVKFLSQTADVVTKNHRPGMNVLDFGCGKEAALCRILRDRGIECRGYDPLYGHLLAADNNSYQGGGICDDNSYLFDMIILSEVIEHIRDLKKEAALLNKLLSDNGIVIIRTQLYDDPSAFPNWWYDQDPTHINFFSEKSLDVLAKILGRRVGKTDHGDIFLLAVE